MMVHFLMPTKGSSAVTLKLTIILSLFPVKKEIRLNMLSKTYRALKVGSFLN